MVLTSTGCLFPHSNAQGLRVNQCTPETCVTYPLYSVVSARCAADVKNISITSSQSFLPPLKSVKTRCMVNRTSEIFYWFPPVQDCFSARSGVLPYFYGSIYTLRQLQQAFHAGKASALAVREKPLVSLSVGMSALSVVLVLIMLLGVCHRNAPDSPTGRGNPTQRQRQLAARRLARARSRRQNGNHTSIGTQASVESSDRVVILPRIECTSRVHPGGVNAGFHDSEALLTQSHELAGQTPTTGTLEVPQHGGQAEVGAEAGVSATSSGLNDDFRLSCLAVPHGDALNEYQLSTHPPKVFKGVPTLPTYEDATKRGMYCIIRDSDITAPPAYQHRISDGINTDGDATISGSAATGDLNSPDGADVFPPLSSWDLGTYGVHRGSINSMPEFSRIYAPPESPYPGDSPQ